MQVAYTNVKRRGKVRYPAVLLPSSRPLAPLLAATLALLLGGCAERPRFELGTECELTTQCAAPFVCRLGRCREECRSSRDCRPGLQCLRDEGLGACAVDEEGRCALSSDCVDPSLVCVMGQCANACDSDVDCPPGELCIDEPGAASGCRDPSMDECTRYDSECPEPYICAPDGRCREQCIGDRDCRDGTVCDTSMTPTVCVPPTMLDGGVPIDATMPVDATMPTDGGMTVVTPPAPPPLLYAGYQHTCAVQTGQLRCWGDNARGQIGDGTIVDRPLPTIVSALSGTTLVATGSDHTCAYASAGLHCWGENVAGQVGDGSAATSRTSPTAIAGLAPTSIAAARDHSCAVVGSVVHCWGDNAVGQLGDGTTTQRRAPAPVIGLAATPAEIALRGRHTCARLGDGRVQCWGENAYGQLGNGASTSAPTPAPQLATGVAGAVEVVAGSSMTCARRGDGSVLCWGDGTFYQLGDGTTASREVAAPVAGLPPIVELAAGLGHVCARSVDGEVLCWGHNEYGQSGQNPRATPTSNRVRVPTAVAGIAGATELAAGDWHTCARVAAGLRCWGWNSQGQLGDGTTTESWMPVAVGWP